MAEKMIKITIPVELDQFAQQVKAALEDFLVANLVLHNVAGNVLRKASMTTE